MITELIAIAIIFIGFICLTFTRYEYSGGNGSYGIVKKGYPYWNKIIDLEMLGGLYDKIGDVSKEPETYDIPEGLKYDKFYTDYIIVDNDPHDIVVDYFVEPLRASTRDNAQLKAFNSQEWETLLKNNDPYEAKLKIYKHGLSREIAPVNVMYHVYDHFKPKIVYDPIMGWGSRLIAGSKFDMKYLGVQMTNRHLAYHDQMMIVLDTNDKFEYEIYEGYFEDMPYKYDGMVDMIITEPPFFTINKDLSPEQNAEIWTHNILFKALKQAYSILNDKCPLILVFNDFTNNKAIDANQIIKFSSQIYDYKGIWTFKKNGIKKYMYIFEKNKKIKEEPYNNWIDIFYDIREFLKCPWFFRVYDSGQNDERKLSISKLGNVEYTTRDDDVYKPNAHVAIFQDGNIDESKVMKGGIVILIGDINPHGLKHFATTKIADDTINIYLTKDHFGNYRI